MIYGILISDILLCILLALTVESLSVNVIYGLCLLLAKVNKYRNTRGEFGPKTTEVHEKLVSNKLGRLM